MVFNVIFTTKLICTAQAGSREKKRGRSLNTFSMRIDESGDSAAWVENYDCDEDNNNDDDDNVSIMIQLRSC